MQELFDKKGKKRRKYARNECEHKLKGEKGKELGK